MGDNRKELLAAAAAAAASSTGEGGADERLAEQYEGLLAYVKRHSSRSDDLNLGEVFQTMSKKDHTRVWTSVLKAVAPIVDEGRFLAQEEEQPEDESDGENNNRPAKAQPDEAAEQGGGGATPKRPSTPESSGVGNVPGRPRRGMAAVDNGGGGGSGKNENRKRGSHERVALSMEILHAAAMLALEFLADKDRVAPRALMDTAVYLHETILSLQGLQGIALQTVIAKVCEMWWTQERPGAEHLVSCLLPVMLVRSLDLDAKEADVKRMHGLRAALMLLDYDDETGDGLRGLLLRTFISPVYLKCSEGRRLLASFFGLHPSLVAEIHAVIKAQMPGAKKAVLTAYGEVYFRVWRGAEGPYLEKVEMLCLQDLMHACIHASTPKMHQNIRIVLDGLHSQKKVKGVDADLLRLYGPVMWRSLRVANPSVRAQACQVLVDAFPLQDPAAGAAAYDTTLQQQFDALTTLLEDTHPEVRAVAAKGACRVLSVFWEMVPIDTTRALLTRVVGRLASDGASPLVRLAAVEGLTLLLECPASHSVLKSMLPGVQNLIHDNNKKVRTAFVGLLLAVKGVKSIRYYQVANVDHILARLSEDHLKCPAAALGLSKLILNSYFPTGSGVTGSEQVSRCLTLLSQDEGAAVAFFSRLHKIAGVPSAAKMIAMLVRCVLVAARTPPAADEDDEALPEEGGGGDDEEENGNSRNKGKRKGVDDAKKEGKGQGRGVGLFLSASDSKSVAGILNLIASIWESILPDLSKNVNEPSLELIQQTVTGEALSILHRRFCGRDKCRAAFMRVAGLVGGDLAPGMLEDIVLEMLALPADAPPSAYGPTVDLLCSWGQHEHLLGAVVDSLKRAFEDPDASGRAGDRAVDEDSAASEAGSRGKRRRPVSRKSDPADVKEEVTGLPAPLALNMLGHLLAGGQDHPSTKAARDALMANDEAVDSLEAALVLARSTITARLSSSVLLPGSSTPAAAKEREAKEEDRRRRRCPGALLVRAVEALGRIYMHREATLVDGGGSGSGAGSGATKLEGVGAEEGDKLDQAEEVSMLQPMPFSVKMRELVVWATNTVLPVLVGSGASSGVDMVEGGGGTPVRPAGGASLVAESPSPMPPPRSRARASLDNGEDASAAAATAAAGTAAGALAGGVFGVVVLLASEWVEVGSGLAEISMRADTWGTRLLALLVEEDDEGRIDNMIGSVLPQLCRLSLNLSVRESQGARPPESIWQVLLRCADQRISATGKAVAAEEEQECTSTTLVQKYLAASVALQGKKGGMSSLTERLLGFMFTQAFTSDDEEEQEDQDRANEDSNRGPSIDRLTRLEVCAVQDVDSDEPAGCMLLQLSRPAAAVLASVVRSAAACKAAGALVLSHLSAFGSGDASGEGADACWPLFCAHVLGALIEHAPVKVRLQLAADAHAGLKAAAAAAAASASAAASPLSSSFVSARSGDGNGSVVVSPATAHRRASTASGDASRQPQEEEGVSTRKATAFVVGAIYGRLEAARLAASGRPGGTAAESAPVAVTVSA